ncbi:hypothetical protein CALVIDRAFT_535743 [Calocera viscosa TUFC12733]|uniref:Uncharacterized protein n=1 Tax=Calocera viscosa (strain TUFC12733) TaxID=1330018 RepID=A0A167NWV0_CALVF|nr:hypothetical protein CALVIDRAFT_535743 [Calocera viscosa TUFC12733]
MLSYPRPAPPSSRRNNVRHLLPTTSNSANSTTTGANVFSSESMGSPTPRPGLPSSSSRSSGSTSIPTHLQNSPATQAARMLNIDLSSFSTSRSLTLSSDPGSVPAERAAEEEGDGEGEMTEEWVSELSRDELGRMVMRAERVIRARERELGLAASIGKQLLQRNESQRRRYDRLLSRFSTTGGSPKSADSTRSPGSGSSIDSSFGSVRSAREASLDTASFRTSLFGLHGEDAWSESSTTPQPPRPGGAYRTPPRAYAPRTPHNNTHTRTHTRTPSLLHLRSENLELHAQLEQLEQEARTEELDGRRRLRGLEREIEGLRGELEGLRREEEERERQSREREGSRERWRQESWAAEVHGLAREGGALTWGLDADVRAGARLRRERAEEEEGVQSPTPSRPHTYTHTQTHASLVSLDSVGSLASDKSSYHSFPPSSPHDGRRLEPSPVLSRSTSSADSASSSSRTASLGDGYREPSSAPSDDPAALVRSSPSHRRTRTLTHTDLPVIAQLLSKIRELESTNTDLLSQREGMEARLRSAKKGVRVMEEGIGDVVRELAGLGELDLLEWAAEGRETSASAPSELGSPGMAEDPTVRLLPAPSRAAPSSPLHAVRSRRRKALPPAFLFPQASFDASADMRGPLTAPLPLSAPMQGLAPAPMYAEAETLRPLTAPLPGFGRWPLSRAQSDRSTPTLRHFPRSSSDEDELSLPRDPFLSDSSELSHGWRARTPDVEQEQLEQGWKRLNDELKRSADLGAGALRKRPTSSRGVRSLGEELARVQGGAVLGTLGAGSLKGTWRFTPLEELQVEDEGDSEAEVSAVLRAESESGRGSRDKGKGRAVPMTPPQVNTLDLFEQLNQTVDDDDEPILSGLMKKAETLLRVRALKNAPASTFVLLEKAVEERAAAREEKGEKHGVLGWVEWMLMILLWLDELFPPHKDNLELDDTWTDSSLAVTPETRNVPLPAVGSSRQVERRRPFAMDPRLTRMVGDVWITVLFMWTIGVFMIGVAKKGPRGVLMGESDTRVGAERR